MSRAAFMAVDDIYFCFAAMARSEEPDNEAGAYEYHYDVRDRFVRVVYLPGDGYGEQEERDVHDGEYDERDYDPSEHGPRQVHRGALQFVPPRPVSVPRADRGDVLVDVARAAANRRHEERVLQDGRDDPHVGAGELRDVERRAEELEPRADVERHDVHGFAHHGDGDPAGEPQRGRPQRNAADGRDEPVDGVHVAQDRRLVDGQIDDRDYRRQETGVQPDHGHYRRQAVHDRQSGRDEHVRARVNVRGVHQIDGDQQPIDRPKPAVIPVSHAEQLTNAHHRFQPVA